MEEISQTKTSIECSLYSPIPAVAALPHAQTPPQTQFNCSLSRQKAMQLLLLVLSRLIFGAVFVIVTFPDGHMSFHAVRPVSLRKISSLSLCLCMAELSGIRYNISCSGFPCISYPFSLENAVSPAFRLLRSTSSS